MGACLAFASEPKISPFARFISDAPVEWSVPAELGAETEFSVRVPGFSAEASDAGFLLRIPGQAAPIQPGGPDLPVMAKVVRIAGGNARVEINPSECEEITNVVIAPAPSWRLLSDDPGAVPRPVREKLESAYAVSTFVPEALLAVQTAVMGTETYLRIECRPFQYNPATKTLRFYRDIRGVLTLEASRTGEAKP
jgi:hypothetical protein